MLILYIDVMLCSTDVFGCILSYAGMHVACGLQVGHA